MKGSRTVVKEPRSPGSPEYWGEGFEESHSTFTEVCREMPYSGSGHWHWLIGTVWGQVHHPSASSMGVAGLWKPLSSRVQGWRVGWKTRMEGHYGKVSPVNPQPSSLVDLSRPGSLGVWLCHLFPARC